MGLLLLVAKNSARGSIHDTVRPMTSSTSPWSWHRFLLDWSSHDSFSSRTCVVLESFSGTGVQCEESDSGRKLLSVPTYHFCVGVLGTQCGGLHGRILPKPNRYVNN